MSRISTSKETEVVLCNIRLGVMARLGVGVESLVKQLLVLTVQERNMAFVWIFFSL